MGGAMSKRKGKAGELEFAKYLEASGFPAERGWADGYDIKCEGLPVHFEVKRTERLNLWPSLKQSCDDKARKDKMPVVAHRPNRKPWIIVTYASDYLELHRQIRALRDIVNHQTEQLDNQRRES